MFGKELAHDESYYKEYGEYKISASYTVYEAFIEPMFNKEGQPVLNKDGSPRYRYVEEDTIKGLEEDKLVKNIRDNLYKDVYEVNGDYVEKVDREGKRIYFVVEKEKVTTLPKGSKVVLRNGLYRLLNNVGYVFVDDTEIERPKIISVRPFKGEDHEKEAKELIHNKLRRFNDDNED